MYLAELGLSGFRAFADARVVFNPGVTVLIGENNAGKSGVVDALRLITDPLDGRRSLWPDSDDICRSGTHAAFMLQMSLVGSSTELAAYSDAVLLEPYAASGLAEARYVLNYQPPGPGEARGRAMWVAGGGAVADDPDPGARGRLRHVYLPPLRDAARELGPSGSARIRAIIERLLDDTTFTDTSGRRHDRDRFKAEVSVHLRNIETNPVLAKAADLVNEPLSELTGGAQEQATDLGYGRAELASLVRGLRMRMADVGLEPRELAESGMGYANLAYIATVLTHLHAAAHADLTVLLVEEPEAHLHPQLQSVLLDYLKRTAELSQRATDSRWLGRIQVVVTTHAPLLAAHTKVSNIVVLQRRQLAAAVQPDRTVEEVGPTPSSPTLVAYTSVAVAVRELRLSSSDEARVNRYLDATRSSMLFGPRTILVEGIAEAILLPVLARRQFADDRSWIRFVGSAIVPIDGVDFAPYLRMLLTQAPTGCIAQRVAVVTDADPGKRSDPIGKLRQQITHLNATDVAEVFAAPSTLEPELLEAGNAEAFWPAWEIQRPAGATRVRALVDAAPTADYRARIVISAMKRTRLRKGDFAQDFLDQVASGDHDLRVPSYVSSALTWLVATQ